MIQAEGLLEDVGDHAMIRWPCYNMAEGPDDLFVSIGLVRDFSLQTGLQVACTLRAPMNGTAIAAWSKSAQSKESLWRIGSHRPDLRS